MAEKKKEENKNTYESLRELYYSGKVRPSLNKITAALETDPENLQLNLLACQILQRTKEFDRLSTYADIVIKLSPDISEGYYYKGVSLQQVKGSEQEALINFNKALKINPENTLYLKNKATTHLSLFKDYDLPLKFAEQHRVKAETALLKVVELMEQKENPDYLEFYTLAEVNMMMDQALNAKMYYLKAVNAFEETDSSEQNHNIYKDIVKAQKHCIKLLEKFTE